MSDRIVHSIELFAGFLEQSLDVMWAYDLNSRSFLFVSRSAESLFGISREQLLSMEDPWGKIIHPEDLERVHELRRSLTPTSIEYRVLRPDGSLRWAEERGRMILEDDGLPIRHEAVVTDITEKWAAQQMADATLKRLQEEILRSEEALAQKSHFLAVLSHEIRTPLHAVIGFINVLRNAEALPHQREWVERLSFSADHLLSLVNDVLDFSKLEEGAVELEQAPFSIHETARALVHMLSLRAAEKRIELKIESSGPDIRVLGDPVRIRQVMTNLVANAIKFTDEGSVTLRVATVLKAEALHAEIAVIDTGIGIEQEKLGRIFEKYVQAQASTTRKYGGTGLGLSIARSLVQQMGADILVDSRVGIGSTFSFSLQLPLASPSSSKILQTQGLQGVSVLIVDDNPVNLLIARQFLSLAGAVCGVATHGAAALQQAGSGNYDIILMDLEMPDMNGSEVTKHLRELGKQTPILGLSAASSSDVREHALRSGMNGYLRKPFHPEELKIAILELLEQNTSESPVMLCTS